MKIKILLFLTFTGCLLAKEYEDPLSGVCYEIPGNAPTKSAKKEDDHKLVYMLAYRNQKTQAVIVYSTKLRDALDKRSPEKYMEEDGAWQPGRPNRHLTKESWRNVGGKSYYVSEAYDKDGSAYTYFVYYALVRDGYVFIVCFTTGYNPMSMWEEWDKVVMAVKYPASK